MLSEAVLARREELKGRVVVELGGGLGLVSIVAARAAEPAAVYLTDRDDEAVLALARENVAANCCSAVGSSVLTVVALDWEKEAAAAAAAAAHEPEGKEARSSSGRGSDGTTKSAGPAFEAPDAVLAADVIYDDRLTDAFFVALRRLLWARAPDSPVSAFPYCLLALERRPVFSIAHLAVISHGYGRFREQLAWDLDRTPRPLEGRQVPLDQVPIYLCGTTGGWRGGEGDDGLLELWEIKPQRG